MHYFFEDLIGFAAATPLALILILMPGFGIASLMARARLVSDDSIDRTCWGLLLGIALLPASDALVLRWVGMGAVLLVHMALAAAGVRPLLKAAARVPMRWWAAVGGAWIAAAWANLDFDWHGRLYQSVLVIDLVKHAAVIGSLAKHGVPLGDPFFAREGAAGYYYYFYVGPALIHWLAGPLVDSRVAFAAATFVTLLAFPAILVLIAHEAALIRHDSRTRFVKVILLLCCLSGLDLIGGLWLWLRTGHVLAQLDWWNEEVRWALTSVLWVPHHITAVIALFTGCLVLAQRRSAAAVVPAILAGVAFATSFGSSLWVALAAVPILALWWMYERTQVGTAFIWELPLSGLAALLLCLPQIKDIENGRALSGPPIMFYMRPVGPISVLPHTIGEWIVHLAVTPGGYLIEFGIFALGAIVFLKRGGFALSQSTPIGRLLLVSAPIALLLVTFLRSAVLYNDFGWRAIWLAQVPAMVWTASVLSSEPNRLKTSPAWTAAFTLGLAASLWDLTGMRLIRPYYFLSFINQHPEVDDDERGAYRWIERAVPPRIIVQHNPADTPRAFDFGLYGDRRVAVADREAQLFGAPAAAVHARISLLRPIFEHPMLRSELDGRASAAGVGAILLTSADPLWQSGDGPPRDWKCRYRSMHSCVMILEEVK